MTNLTIVNPAAQPAEQAAERPYNAAANSLGCWTDAVAFLRLEHLIAQGFASYMAAQNERPGLTVSRHLALRLAQRHPGFLDAVRSA